MAAPLFGPLFSALNGTGVRYVVVGGLAVVLHGHPRLTADVDIVLDLEPVDPVAFADPRQRESWIKEKGMTMKRVVGRPQDLADIEALEELRKQQRDGEPGA